MLQLNFSNNPNGKLFADIFGDIRLADYEKFQAGNIIEIILAKQAIGRAQVMGYKDFSFKRLTDTVSMMNCGRGAGYQAKMLNSFYKGLNEESMLMHIVFKWQVRYMENQTNLMNDWWRDLQDQYPHTITTFHHDQTRDYI